MCALQDVSSPCVFTCDAVHSAVPLGCSCRLGPALKPSTTKKGKDVHVRKSERRKLTSAMYGTLPVASEPCCRPNTADSGQMHHHSQLTGYASTPIHSSALLEHRIVSWQPSRPVWLLQFNGMENCAMQPGQSQECMSTTGHGCTKLLHASAGRDSAVVQWHGHTVVVPQVPAAGSTAVPMALPSAALTVEP
jgi:hypothetical protein